jgi:hypothetical protein
MATTAPPPADDQPARTRPFADVIVDLGRGQLHRELSDELQDLIAAVMDTGKKGSITLQLQVSKSKSGEQVEIVDVVKVAQPKAARPASIFFVDHDHNVTRTDPNQIALPLREVPSTDDTRTVELKEASNR